MTDRIFEVSPRFKARIAGVLYLFSLLTAILGESRFRGSLSYAASLIAVSGMVAVTLLICDIVKLTNRSLAWLAACFSLVGLTFEALRWNPQGLDIALVFHGLYCILIGYLIFRSAFLPRILGGLMALAGLAWLTFISPPLATYLSPYNAAFGILGEAMVFLWLLVAGVSVQPWKRPPRVRT
jgi:hypothetical protein